MSEDELREALAERIPFTTSVLFHGPSEWPSRDERLRIAGLLLPVVRRYAAEELWAAADALESRYGWPSRQGNTLRGLADALTREATS